MLVRAGRRARRRRHELLPASSIQPVGFTDDEALLPVTLRSFQGYRLLQEYFSFPQRFRFFELTGLRTGARAASTATRSSWSILLGRGDADARERRRRVEPGAVLHAGDQPVPRSAPIASTSATATYEYHVVAGSDAAARFRGLRGHRRRRPRRRRRQRAAVPAVLSSAYSSDDEHQQSAYFTTRREPRLVSAGPEAPRPAIELHRHAKCSCRSSIRRRRRSAATCGSSRSRRCAPTAIWCCRCRSASAQSDFSLDVAAPVDEHSRRSAGPSRPYRAAGRRRGRVARDQPSVAQLPVAASIRPAQQGAAALRDLLELYAPSADVSARRQIEGIRSVQRAAASCGRLPTAQGRSPSAAGSRSRVRRRRAGVRRRQRVSARRRCSIVTSRATCRSTRSPKPCCGRRAAAKSTDGCRNGARDRRSSVLRRRWRRRRTATTSTRRCGGSSACTTSKPRWGAALRPVDEPVRLGQDPDLSFAPAPLASFELGQDGAPPRLQVRLFGLLGPNGPLPIHLTEYARERLRHAGDPTLSRFLDLFHHRFLALFYRAWAQAQPHVNRDRPKDDRFTDYVGAFIGMSPASFRDRDTLPDLAQALSCRRAHPPGAQRRRAGGTSSSTSSACRCGSRNSSATGCRSAPRERTLSAAATARRSASGAVLGRPRVGPSAQVPDSSRPADARRNTRAFCRGGGERDSDRCGSWSTGSGCISASSSIGTSACTSKRDEVPAADARADGRLGWTTWLGDAPSADAMPTICASMPKRSLIRESRAA